jgi:hypothetical protein
MYKFEELPNGSNSPIILMTLSNPYNPHTDSLETSAHIKGIFEASNDDVYCVADMSTINVSFSDLVLGLSEAFKNPESIFSNPRIHMYTVGSSELLRLGTEAVANQAQYGQVGIKIYGSVPEAVTQIQTDMTAKA